MNFEPSKNSVDKIKSKLSGKPKPKLLYVFQKFTFSVIMFSSLFLAYLSLHWLVSQAKVFYVFWPYITTSASGLVWVLIPEFAIAGILFVGLIYLIYKQTDWFGVAWADYISAALIIVIVLSNSLVTTNAVSSLPIIESVHQSFLNLPYRIWLRDTHIKDLEQKQEYYGVLVSVENNIIAINHGGVILQFKVTESTNLKLGQRIWVKFINEGGVRLVTDQKVWEN